MLAQHVRDLPQRLVRDLDAVQDRLYAFEVAARVADDRRVEPRRHPRDGGPGPAVVQTARGEDAPPAARLAHLDADARRRRARLAGQAPAGVAQLLGHLAQLDLGRRRELAGSQAHEALAACPAAGADVRHLDADARERVHERLALGDLERHPDRFDEDLRHASFPVPRSAPRATAPSQRSCRQCTTLNGSVWMSAMRALRSSTFFQRAAQTSPSVGSWTSKSSRHPEALALGLAVLAVAVGHVVLRLRVLAR